MGGGGGRDSLELGIDDDGEDDDDGGDTNSVGVEGEVMVGEFGGSASKSPRRNLCETAVRSTGMRCIWEFGSERGVSWTARTWVG